jgi:UPF0716 family protein affecting phage T7 exclusion
MIFTPILLLPLFEIFGFVMIGGEIGFGLTVIWLIGSAWLGFSILGQRGRTTFERAAKAQGDEIFATDDLFDGICYVIASLLLIFPGFISDFIAIPFLVAPFRRFISRVIRANPAGYAGQAMREGQKFTAKKAADNVAGNVIDGEYKVIDKDKSPD